MYVFRRCGVYVFRYIGEVGEMCICLGGVYAFRYIGEAGEMCQEMGAMCMCSRGVYVFRRCVCV